MCIFEFVWKFLGTQKNDQNKIIAMMSFCQVHIMRLFPLFVIVLFVYQHNFIEWLFDDSSTTSIRILITIYSVLLQFTYSSVYRILVYYTTTLHCLFMISMMNGDVKKDRFLKLIIPMHGTQQRCAYVSILKEAVAKATQWLHVWKACA